MTEDLILATPRHHGLMTYRGSTTRWERSWEITDARWTCRECPTTVTVTAYEWSPKPA